MPLTSGSRLGPYEIIAPLGAGGMGEVFKARDTRLDRIVAIKILPEALAGDPQFRDRFDREARAISQLDHPRICALYDVGEAGATRFLVMQYLEGETLADRLTHAKGPLPLEHVLNIGIDIADALDKAHRAGVVHRDLKPANVMLTKSGATLLDFGLAKLRAPAVPIAMSAMTVSPATAQGTILGTIQYMAPEQVEGREADKRSDIWALGAVLYEMATGRRAFDGASAASVIGAIMKDTPPAVSTRQPLAPSALDHVVERCLEKNADERWQDAGDVKRELKWIASIRSRPAADVTPAQPGRRAVTWIVTACVVVAAALGVTTLLRARPGSSVSRHVTFSIAPPDQVRSGGSFALSPDGRYFAFVGLAADGAPSLWVRSIDTAATRPLPGTEDASYPFWSPRSDAIGFFAGGMLKTVAIADGVPKTLAPAPNGRGGAWSVDGTILYAFVTSALYRVSAKGGASTVAIPRDTQHRASLRWPAFIDDRHFVFTVQGIGDATTGIYLGSLDSPSSTRLVGDYSNTAVVDGRLLFVSDGALVAQALDPERGRLVGDTVDIVGQVAFSRGLGFGAFSASSTGMLAYTAGAGATSELRWVDRQGKPLGQLGAEEDVVRYNSYDETLSPNGRTLAISAFRSATADIWLVDIARSVASRFTSDDASELYPVWSPDGTELLFASNRGGIYNMYRKPVAGSGEELRLFESTSHQYPTDWSQHGQAILFTNIDAKGQADIWKTSATSDGKPAPVLATRFNEYAARLSPDGQWMAYTSDESGRPEIYVQRFPTMTGKVSISTQGGSEPRWRADGRELFYLAANRRLTAATVTTTSGLSVGRPMKLFDTIVDTSIGSIHAGHYAPTADGQRFLINVSAISATPTTVVLNWAPWTKP